MPEHWELAENMHMAFLQRIQTIPIIIIISILTVQNCLYVMVDLCPDIWNVTGNGNWIALWFDTDNSRQVNSYSTYSFGTYAEQMLNAAYYQRK